MNNNLVIKSSDVGISVNKIQGYLNIFQNYGKISNRVTQDGIFGSGTKMAVQQFQSYSNLAVDGIVGIQTWNNILNELKNLNIIPNIPVKSASYYLNVGSEGLSVYVMQQCLQLFENQIKVDGIYGNKTRQITIKYQTQNNLKSDGIIGSKTWDILIKDKLQK